MFIRHLSLSLCVLLAPFAAFGQTSYIFQVPGTGPGTQILGLGDDNFGRIIKNDAGPAQASQVLATPDGSKFYIASPTGIQSAPSTLTPLTGVVAGSVTAVGMTPDGKYLLVIAQGVAGDPSSAHFNIIATSNNSVVQTDAGVPSGGAAVGFAASPDSQTVWVVSRTSSGASVRAVSLASLQAANQELALQIEPTSIALSPLGLLYVTTVGDLLYEIDPATLTLTSGGTINFPGLSGPLHFASDGTAAYSINKNAPCNNCPVLFQLNVAAHSVSKWPSFDFNNTPTKLDDVFVASSSQIFAFCSCPGNAAKLWDVTTSPLGASPSALFNIGVPIFNVTAAAMSNERPTARFLYLLISNASLYRINVAAQNIGDRQFSTNTNPLSYTPIPAPPGGATSIFGLNRNLTVTPGATSAPLIGYVSDASGRPVYNQSVCFTGDPGVSIARASQVTNADGSVQTTVTAPTTAGPYTVTLSVGACGFASSITSTYTVTVSNSGGGGGGGNAQISVWSGDGQLLMQNTSTAGFTGSGQPLTVRITNPDGTPRSGVPVTFSVQSDRPNDTVTPIDSATDENGLYRATYRSSTLPTGSDHSFRATTVTASTDVGSVQFVETTHNQDTALNIGKPNVTPPDALSFSITEGQTIPNKITVLTTAGNSPRSGEPIPNIGIRLAEADSGLANSKILSCQGSTLGGTDGISHCNVFARCQPPGTVLPQAFNATVAVGEYAYYGIQVTVNKSNATSLSIVSGNGQHGAPTASFNLLAKVTDGCGRSAAGVSGLTWDVTPKGAGSASIQSQTTTSASDGTVFARVTLGSTPGPVQVTLSGPGLTPIAFQLTTDIIVSSLSIVSGDAQSVVIGQAFPNPVVFKAVTSNGTPVAGALVNFSVLGNATISPGSATTNAQGQVQTTVTAVSSPGTILVTATTGSVSVTATLSSRAPGPAITGNSFTNAASGAVGMTPCGLVTVTGSGLAPNVTGTISAPTLAGIPEVAGLSITVTVGGSNIAAPILSVSNLNGVQSANFQAPCELSPGTATVVVKVNGITNSVGVQVFAAQPGIFVVNGNNNGYVVRAANPVPPVTAANPPRTGDTLYMIVTGLGSSLTPTATTGVLGAGQRVNYPIGVQINGSNVPVPSNVYAAGYVGVYIVEFQIPSGAALGVNQSLNLAAIVNNNAVFSNTVTLPGIIAP